MKIVRYIIGALLVVLMACQQHEEMETMEEPVKLTFKLSMADTGSRGLEDGDYLDVVSVYIVNANKEIVAKKENISVGATEKVVVFEESDKLKRGIHTLMAVANHSSLGTNFVSGSYDDLINNRVHATSTTSNISPKNVVQPLSLMKEIELHAGNNQVEGELVRTFARLHIEVKNNSGSLPLRIKSLTFSENFSQQQAYVFDDGTDRKYFGETGAPVATYDQALTPFTLDNGKLFKTIGSQTSAVLFDAYLLESKAANGEKFTYTLEFDYDDKPYVTNNIYLNRTDIDNNYEESYFLIQNVRSGRFIKDNNQTSGALVQGNDSEDFLRKNIAQGSSKDYLWELVKVGDHSYRIKNVATNRYIGQPNRGSVPMVSSSNNPYYIFYNYISTSNDTNSTGVQLGYQGNSNGRILNDWSAGGSVIGGYNMNDGGNPFKFHLVEKSIKYDDPIVLTTIDPVTQQSAPVTAIKRNDYIKVFITVSYNPVAGKFEFVVQDWNTGQGNVEFN